MKIKKNDNDFLLSVDNIDDYLDDDKDDPKFKHAIHPLLIRPKSRIIVVGGSGSGKTNFLCNALMKPQLKFEKIYMYSKNLFQPKYQFIKKELDNTEFLLNKKTRAKKQQPYKIVEVWSDNINDLISLDELKKNKEYLNLVIIDDFPILSKQMQDTVGRFFTQCRHYNCTIIYLQQLYFQLPRSVRNNLSHIVIFQNNNKKEKDMLAQQLGGNLEKGQFSRLYNKILSKKYNWMLIDNTTDDINMMYRSGYTKLLCDIDH